MRQHVQNMQWCTIEGGKNFAIKVTICLAPHLAKQLVISLVEQGD